MAKRKHYSHEFKMNALRLAENSGKSISQIERELDLSAGLLHKWKRRYKVNQRDAEEATLEKSELEEAKAEIRRLKRELEITRQERAILKKAVSIFSQEQP